MARITVEDCLSKVKDHFELVVVASERAKELHDGSPPLVARDGDKDTVLSLREMEADRLSIDELRNHAILSFRARVPFKETETDAKEIDFIEKEIMSQVADADSVAAATATDNETAMSAE